MVLVLHQLSGISNDKFRNELENFEENKFQLSCTSRWELYDTVYTERYMSTPDDNPVGYNQSSPLWHLDNLRDKKVNEASSF